MSSESGSSGELGRWPSCELGVAWPYIDMVQKFEREHIRYSIFDQFLKETENYFQLFLKDLY